MATMTVTASPPADRTPYMSLGVVVFTGAAVTQDGRAVTADESYASITPKATGSRIIGGVGSQQNMQPLDWRSTTTEVDTWDGDIPHLYTIRSTDLTTAETPVTIGAVQHLQWQSSVLYEVLADGTLAIDASSPARTALTDDGSDTTTTDSFTPPAGSLLVAVVVFGGWCDRYPTVADSEGLVWTKQVSLTAGNDYWQAVIYTASLPNVVNALVTPTCVAATTAVNGPALTTTALVMAACVNALTSIPAVLMPWWWFARGETTGAEITTGSGSVSGAELGGEVTGVS